MFFSTTSPSPDHHQELQNVTNLNNLDNKLHIPGTWTRTSACVHCSYYVCPAVKNQGAELQMRCYKLRVHD
ncbi:hypothetical protein PVAP13_9NG418628 [Panicum virgatum]|uniref:Uncharacterized protein n=1 Tax=Panicum virgatum TaxID=38727 RepID=A0A8T0MUW6_PANVG|nr:hypothetical protein PVAP13_9NG418628 [Panicum virgatum]